MISIFLLFSISKLSSILPFGAQPTVLPESGFFPLAISFSFTHNSNSLYEIEIIKILNGEDNKDFIIKVTDEALIEQTGGIVRGMSGSPIIRDGKIIGAVTHVMVSDPKKGFAISAEHMISP